MKTLRPGISAALLEKAALQQLSSAEALRRFAINHSGIWIPYRAWDGNLLREEGGPELGRMMLAGPGDGPAYHCATASRCHAYLPPGIKDLNPDGDLFLCDNEFRTLSLTETGVAAIGLQGIGGFIAGDGGLAPELVEAMLRLAPRRVILVGNSDSCLDFEFSKAAVSLRAKLGIATLHLVRTPLDMPVGIDEVRESLKDSFPNNWAKWIEEAVPVVAATKAPDLAVDLITREAVDNLQGQRRHDVEQLLVELADAIEDAPLAQGRLIVFAIGDLRIPQFRHALKLHRDHRVQALKAPTTSPLPEPWPEPVDGAALLEEIRAFIRRFMIMTDEAVAACAVWALHTWVTDSFDFTPLLHVDSPEKGCGKSTLRRVLAEIVPNPKSTSGITEATVFRCVGLLKATMLMDEWDVLSAKDRGTLTKILNAGVEPDGTVDRCIGGDIQTFKVFGPKAIFGIQKVGLSDSTASRTIHVTLHRPLPDEKPEPFRPRLIDNQPLRRRCVRWANDNRKLLETANPIQPSWMRDRKAQVWLPLMAIADHAGQAWPDAIRRVAKVLSVRTAATYSPAHLAIMDALTVFERNGVDRMFSVDLVEHMIRLAGEMNEKAEGDFRPWKDGFKGGGTLTQIRLSDLLRPYNIEPQSIRLSQNPQTRKGYYKAAFQNIHDRYIGRHHPNQTGTPAQGHDDDSTPNAPS